jgi:hypothetical protein
VLDVTPAQNTKVLERTPVFETPHVVVGPRLMRRGALSPEVVQVLRSENSDWLMQTLGG